MASQPFAAFDVGDRHGEKAHDEEHKQQVHHERSSSVDTTTLIARDQAGSVPRPPSESFSSFFTNRTGAPFKLQEIDPSQ
jgi:hypothetical protein